MTAQEQQDEFHDIRDAVAKLCAQFPGEYWRKLDRQMAYPKEFVVDYLRGYRPIS